MASSYDVQSYLLDRANIHDTVSKLPWYYDTKNITGLANEVFAPEIHIDYGNLIEGGPFTIGREAWANRLEGILGAFESTQHVYTCVIAHLPQPGAGPRPEQCVVDGEAQGYMVRKDGEKKSLARNGGQCTFEMVRLPELEAKGQNPWRVGSQTVRIAWAETIELESDDAKPSS